MGKWLLFVVMTRNTTLSITIVHPLQRFSAFSHVNMISFFLIQNKLSNEWPTICVAQLFLWELWLKISSKRNLYMENRNSSSGQKVPGLMWEHCVCLILLRNNSSITSAYFIPFWTPPPPCQVLCTPHLLRSQVVDYLY